MKWCAFDIETSGNRSDFVLGSVYSDQVQTTTDDLETFVNLLRGHAELGYTLVAHNAEFDVVNALWRAGQDVTLHYYNATFTTAYWFWHKRKPSAQVWDSLNLSAGLSLAELGESLGLPKYEMPQRLKGLDPDRFRWVCEPHGVGECFDCYALRDAEIVYRFITELDLFMHGYGLEMRRTLASNAVQLWQLLDPDKQQTVRSDRILQLAAAAIHGGRVEPFMYGELSDVYVNDVWASYAAVMLGSPMPDCRYLIHAKGWPRHLDWNRVEGVIEAEVYQPPTRFPVLPVVHQERLYYPVGLLRGSWAICELRAALARGAELRNVYQLAWADRFVYPFTGTVGALVVLDQELEGKDDPRRAVAKTLRNALPGRLGMVTGGERRIYRRRTPGLRDKDRVGAELQFAAGTAYLVKNHQVPRPPTTSNPLWAAIIYAQARLKLLEGLEGAGATAIYCDTDSVFTTVPVPTAPRNVGDWRFKGRWDRGLFLSPKQYRLEQLNGTQVTRAKGVPAEVVEAYFKSGRVEYDSNLGVIRALNLNLEPGSWMQVKRERSLTPARRHLLNPAALLTPGEWTDTEPVVFGPDGPATS